MATSIEVFVVISRLRGALIVGSSIRLGSLASSFCGSVLAHSVVYNIIGCASETYLVYIHGEAGDFGVPTPFRALGR